MTNAEGLRAVLQKFATKEGQNALAKRLGISTAYLSDVLWGKRTPGPKILAGLGYRRVILYEKHK